MATDPVHKSPATGRRSFRDAALASGLVTAAEFDAAEAVARARPAAGEAAGPSPRSLDETTAEVLVERGTLTPFQARELRAGHHRFRLGQYTVIDEIGRGGMGQVFKAEHALMGRIVAVKVLPRSKATPESEAAFRREMRILGRLDHENVVRAFDAGFDAQVYYLVTEFVPGRDVRRHVKKYGPLDETSAASVFVQVAKALAFAHGEGIVHRDVKPGNILVMHDGRVKVLDLGLAGSTLEAEALQLGRVVGTMDYIAPEQIRTPDAVGPAADIYALGCSMYFALSGKVPFPDGTRSDKMRRHLKEAPTPLHRVAPHVSQPLCRIVEAMMAKDVADRIGTAADVIQRLSRWAPERPVPLPQVSHAAVSSPVDDAANVGHTDSWIDADSDIFVGSSADAPSAGDAAWQRRRDVALGDSADRFPRSDEGDDATVMRAIATAVRLLLPGALVGLGFATALHLVRWLDPSEFDGLLGASAPSVGGWLAFTVITACNVAPIFGRGGGR